MADFYNRGDGVPDAGKNLFPGQMGDEPLFEPEDANGVKTSKGGPATFSGPGASADDVLDSSGYRAPGEERAGAEQGPSFDDVQNSA